MLAEKLREYIKGTLLIVTEKESDFNFVRRLSTDSECVMVDGLEVLIDTLETFSPRQLVTILITSNIPKDIEDSMSIFVTTLESINGMNFIETSKENIYFKNSLVIESLYDFEATDEEVMDKNNADENESYLIGAEEKINIEKVEIETNEEKQNTDDEKIKKLNNIITLLDKELKDHKNKLKEMDFISKELEKEKVLIKEELKLKDREIINLKLQGNKGLENSNELMEELKSREYLIKDLEEDIKELKVKGVELEIDSSSKKELIIDKNKEIRKLKSDIEELINKINSLTESIDSMEETHVTVDKVKAIENVIKDKDLEIAGLNDQVRVLKIDIRKSLDEYSFLEEEFNNLQEDYKNIVTNSDVKSDGDINGVVFDDDVKTTVFYFKMYSQPPYFKSFIESLNRLLNTRGNTLMIIIRETDEISKYYYEGLNEYNHLDEISEDVGDKIVLLKPSKFMLTEDDNFYKRYDNMIVIDYSRNKKVLIKGNNVHSIYTFINEREKELLDIEGRALYVGDNSVVDLRYDDSFKFAKTDYVKKAAVDKKVKNWLVNIGIRL